MTAVVAPHPWSKDALLNKARLYVGRMQGTTPDDDQYGLWSSLALELLARAALVNLAPALLADRSDWRNIAYAQGLPVAAAKFSPKSAATNEILQALAELVPEFTQEMAGFCIQHASRRNAELHTGELVFGAANAFWLPRFYEACVVLLRSMGESDGFFDDHADVEKVVQSLHDDEAKKVNANIAAHRTVWSAKSPDDQAASIAQSVAWATRIAGHRATCPACACTGLVQGTPHGPARISNDDGGVIEKQALVPATFECIACQLRIQGLAKLTACGLGDVFTATSRYTAAEYYGLYTEAELEEARAEYPPEEPDFNDD